MSVELVIFDLGRVLIQLCDGWQHACEVAGLDRPRRMEEGNAQRLLKLVCANEVGALGQTGFLDGAAPLMGISVDHVKLLSDAYLLGTYPGAIKLLDDLRAKGLKTACLSNTNENHWRLICDPQDRNYLPPEKLTHAFASHLVGLRKPDAAIYAHVERVTGISPERIVFFDDLAENIAAATARGWVGYQVAVGVDPVAQMRSYLCKIGVAVG